MKGLSGGLTPSHTKLQLNFFLSYYFNIFFGNKYFGGFTEADSVRNIAPALHSHLDDFYTQHILADGTTVWSRN
jgi:hypothetical protein